MTAAKEIQDIICAYEEARKQRKQVALATVVKVEGSSYRKPGARMLITDSGQLTGSISGGCLEGDTMRKAFLVMATGKPAMITYDTMEDEEEKPAASPGCNGIIHIWIQPLHDDDACNPVLLLKEFIARRRSAVLTTVLNAEPLSGICTGSSFLYFDGDQANNNEPLTPFKNRVRALLGRQSSTFIPYVINGSACHVFVEHLDPPLAIIVVGAGNDAIPLTQVAGMLGWHITVVDGRPGFVTSARFPQAHKLLVARAGNILAGLHIDTQTVAVLMTHNYTYDLQTLRELAGSPIDYIGILGPRKKHNKMLSELEQSGTFLTLEQRSKIYGPSGLDIGAESPAEIALSIISEIKKIMSGHSGMRLRDKDTAIHEHTQLSLAS